MVFLATTALDQFWDKNSEKVLFLGEWCNLYRKKNENKKINFETLDYIWKDYLEIEKGIKYSEDIYELIINKLVPILNKYHNVGKDYKYWNVLLKPWLSPYIQIMYDKYRHMKLALDRDNEVYTFTMDEKSYQYVSTYEVFNYNIVTSDEYNLQLYSQIIKFLKVEHKNINNFSWSLDTKINIKATKKEKVLRTLSSLLNKLFNKNEILMVSPYFKNNSIGKIILLSLKSKFLFKFDNLIYDIKLDLSVNNIKRLNTFDIIFEGSEFENLLFNSFIYNFPLIYLEGYHKFNNKAISLFENLPKAIYSANALHSNELFKFYLANKIDKTYFLYGQHGGGIGIDNINTVENIERSLSDTYFTFGWKGENTRVLPWSITKKEIKKSNNINFIMMALPRYFYRFTYLADGTKMLDYIENSKSFLKSIENIDNVVIRLYSGDYGWQVKERLLEINNNLSFNNDVAYYKQITESKLNIYDHMHTGYLESLSMNLPTIIIIPPNVYNFRDTAKPHIEQLKKAKILFENQFEAACFLYKIYEDVDSWWFSKDVQEIREEFCYQYSRSSNSWDEDWIYEFKKFI